MGNGEDLRSAAVRDLVDHMLARTVEAVGAHAGALFLLEPGGEILTLAVSAGMPLDFLGPLRRVRVAAGGGPVAEALQERRPVWIGSGEEIARRYPKIAAVLPHPRAVAVIPLLTGSTAWGALLALLSESDPGPDTPVGPVLTTAAESIAWVVKGAAAAGHHLWPQAEPRFLAFPSPESPEPAQAQAAVDFLAAVPEGSCQLDPQGRVTFVDPTAAAVLGGDNARLVGARLWEAVPWLADPELEYRHQAAIVSRLPATYIARPPAGGRLLFVLHPGRNGVSLRITPADSRQEPDGPDPPDRQALAGADRLNALHHRMHLSSALSEAVSVRQVADLVADQLLLALQAQTFGLLVAEEDRVRLVGHRGVSPGLVRLFEGVPLATDVPVPGLAPHAPAWGLAQGVASFFASPEDLRAAYPEAAEASSGVAAWAWLPLMVSGQLVGLCVVGYSRRHPFTLEERAVCTSLATLIAQALDRARQHDATHQLAEDLQASLLPRALAALPGLEATARYLPANRRVDVGGDFYDVIRVSATEAVAVIGDVEGHSVSAAGLMGQVRTAVHAYALSGATPGEVLARTNRLLIDLDAELLCSCLCVTLDLARHTAHLATAGHWPPLLRRPGHPGRILDLPPGPLLGVDPAARYPITGIDLPPGAVLALFTDGLIEIPGTDHDSNIAELAAALSGAGGGLDALADTLLTHGQPPGHRADDTALLLLKVG
ncbi:SpoIIE family protein phosphatase [Streptomyces sp. NPDC049040]|uniref:SpoIIE family protein phosphatase n=1 Tax=Streptomyces sp. NPDC049040 TaxID=3365593 RepID=UPI0037183FF7